MGIINPETGAIPSFYWVSAQEDMTTTLKAISDAQKLINPKYAFQVEENLYRPTIETIENVCLVNNRIERMDPFDVSLYDETQKVIHVFDCYVRGKNESHSGSLVPADEVAVQRLHYLVAMVYYALTQLSKYYHGLGSDKISPKGLNVVFNPVEDVENSFEPYAPAQVQFECWYPYGYQDLENLPSLESVKIDLGSWAARIKTT